MMQMNAKVPSPRDSPRHSPRMALPLPVHSVGAPLLPPALGSTVLESAEASVPLASISAQLLPHLPSSIQSISDAESSAPSVIRSRTWAERDAQLREQAVSVSPAGGAMPCAPAASQTEPNATAKVVSDSTVKVDMPVPAQGAQTAKVSATAQVNTAAQASAAQASTAQVHQADKASVAQAPPVFLLPSPVNPSTNLYSLILTASCLLLNPLVSTTSQSFAFSVVRTSTLPDDHGSNALSTRPKLPLPAPLSVRLPTACSPHPSMLRFIPLAIGSERLPRPSPPPRCLPLVGISIVPSWPPLGAPFCNRGLIGTSCSRAYRLSSRQYTSASTVLS